MATPALKRVKRDVWVQVDESASPDVRDKRKHQVFKRITVTAQKLFRRNGYERTTLRQIAARARVSAATIVNYFGEKRDLLEVLFNEEHLLVSQQAALELSESKEFLDQSIDGFRHYYKYFGAYPDYARAILAGGTFTDPAVPASSPAGQTIARSIARIKLTVEIARKRHEITLDESDDALALLIFEIYQSQCRYWLAATTPDVEQGLAQLRRALSILHRGLGSNLPSRDIAADEPPRIELSEGRVRPHQTAE